MENVNINQIEADIVLINADIIDIINEKEVNKKLIDDDIDYFRKKQKVDSILLDKERAKQNLSMFLERRKLRLNGEECKMYNSAA